MSEEGTAIRAVDQFNKDARFRAIAYDAVARAMRKYGRIDPEEAERGAQDIALDAVVVVLQTIYEGDTEIAALKAQADSYKVLCEELLSGRPPPPMITAPSPSPVVEVSEEMVIAAINAYDNDDGDGKNAFKAMRAALVAALRVR